MVGAESGERPRSAGAAPLAELIAASREAGATAASTGGSLPGPETPQREARQLQQVAEPLRQLPASSSKEAPAVPQPEEDPNANYSSLDYSHLMQEEPTTPLASEFEHPTSPRRLTALDGASMTVAPAGTMPEKEAALPDVPGGTVAQPPRDISRDSADLCEAAARGNTTDVHSLLHGPRQIPPGARNAENYTPLHLASAAGAVEVVRQLLLAGADSRARAPSGSTPLHTACRSNQVAVVDVLLREGRALINLADGAGKTAVHIAAEFGHEILLHRLLEQGAAFTRLDEHSRTALQLAVDKCGATSTVARRLAKQRWTTQLYKSQYRMETRVEWRGVPAEDKPATLIGAMKDVRLDGAEVIQAQSEMNDGAFDGIDFSEFTEWIDIRRTYPSLHSRAHGSLQRKLRVGALDTDPVERRWPLRVCFGVDLASGQAISLLTFRHAADFHRELRVRVALYEAAPLALAPGPPLRAYEDFRQPTPYCAIVPGWDSTAAAAVARYGGRGVGRAHAVAICFGILQVLSVMHAARIVHSRVNPETAVRMVGGGTWSLVEFHTALPFGADFGADLLKKIDPVYCAPELHHGQGRGVTVATPAWDIWGVGALLVLLLTGKRIAIKTSMELLGKTDTIADMAHHLQDLPQDPVLLDLVWQLIRYHPRQRIQAAEALRHPSFVAFGFAFSSAVDGGLGLGPSFAAAPDLSRTMPVEVASGSEEEAYAPSDSLAEQMALTNRAESTQDSPAREASDSALVDAEQPQVIVGAEDETPTADATPSGDRDDEMGTTSEEYSTYSSSEYSETGSSSDDDNDKGDQSSTVAKSTPQLEPEPEPEPEREEKAAVGQLRHEGSSKTFMEQEKASFNVFERKKRVLSAMHIQRVARGHLARVVVRAIHDKIGSDAAVIIQAAARGWLTRRSPSAAMVSAVTAAARSGVMVESPTQLPQAFSADAPPPPGSPTSAGLSEQHDLHGLSMQIDDPDSKRTAWLKIIDRNTQKPYYWNRITEEVQWDEPVIEEHLSERDVRIAAKTRYYADFIGPADAALRAEVEVDEELDAEEQEKLKGTKDEMKQVFDRIDENGNGYLDAEELRKLASIIDPDGLSSQELEAALSMMDEDGDDEIDFEEFFEWWNEVNARTDGKMFAIFDKFRAALKAETEMEEAAQKPRRVVERFDDKKGKLLARTLRNELEDMFTQSGLDMKEAFRAFDADGDGTITQDEFKAGLRSLQLKITEDQIDDLVRSIDQDGDGNLDYLEFVNQFQPKGLKGKSSALAKVIFKEEERLGYHDGAETVEELAEIAAAERKRIESTDEDYDTPGDARCGVQVTVVSDDGTEAVDTGGGGEACAVPPLTPFRVCTASMPLPPKHPDTNVSGSCPRLFCVLPSPHAKPRPEGVVERTVLGGGFFEEDNWRGDTFQLHLLCEWGCGHWLDPKAGMPLSKPHKAMKALAPALRPTHEYLVKSGLFDRCPCPMPSAAIARELAKSTGVSELAMQGSMMAGAEFKLASFTDMILSTAEQSGALPTDARPDPRADDPGAKLPEEQIGSEDWNGPLPDDPQAPPTMGGGTGLGNTDGSLLGGVLGSTALSGSGLERDLATNGRMSAVEESLRQEAALPKQATTFESMLGMHPAAVTARKRYVNALTELHDRLCVSDPMRQWGGLRRVKLDNGETCFLCNRHASQANGVVDLSWQTTETSLTSGQLMAQRAWKYKNPDFRFSRSRYNPRRSDPGPTEAEIIAAERAEHAKKMRAMAAQAEAQKGMEPDHPIERWNLVILSEKGPRYRGLAKGEIGEVISSKYKGEFRVKCPNGTVAYFREEEINYWDEGEENKRIAAERMKGLGHLEDMAIKGAGGTVHDMLGRALSEVDSDEAAEEDDEPGGEHMSFAPRSSRGRNIVSSSCVLM